jgi:hypothetical protein
MKQLSQRALDSNTKMLLFLRDSSELPDRISDNQLTSLLDGGFGINLTLMKVIQSDIKSGRLVPEIPEKRIMLDNGEYERRSAEISRQEVARWLASIGETDETLNSCVLHWLGDAWNKPITRKKQTPTEYAKAKQITPPKKTRITPNRQKQIDAIHDYIKILKMDPTAIPDGEKATLMELCLQEQGDLFAGKDAFLHTWKIGVEHGEFRMKNHDLHARRGQ